MSPTGITLPYLPQPNNSHLSVYTYISYTTYILSRVVLHHYNTQPTYTNIIYIIYQSPITSWEQSHHTYIAQYISSEATQTPTETLSYPTIKPSQPHQIQPKTESYYTPNKPYTNPTYMHNTAHISSLCHIIYPISVPKYKPPHPG